MSQDMTALDPNLRVSVARCLPPSSAISLTVSDPSGFLFVTALAANAFTLVNSWPASSVPFS